MSGCGCGSSCGCGSDCKCGKRSGCKMYPDLAEHGTAATTTVIDLGSGTQKGQIEGFEVAEGGGCDCTKCNCGTSCGCSCCACN